MSDARERRRQNKPLPARVKLAKHKRNECAQKHQKQTALLEQMSNDRFKLVEAQRFALLAVDAKMEVQAKARAHARERRQDANAKAKSKAKTTPKAKALRKTPKRASAREGAPPEEAKATEEAPRQEAEAKEDAPR